MIDKEGAIIRLSKAYPEYVDKLAKNMGTYIATTGEILWLPLISSPLSELVCRNFEKGDYAHCDSLFLEIENLIEHGTQEVRDIICTGFLESLQNQRKLPGKLWAPLLGQRATAFCRSMDEFHGIKTEGLSCYNA
ncbi:hypothetical protein [Marinobacter sp. HN1S83]|uniref:DUF7674 family protein n=1 Tax=Marinobacter sp. HN1S83 TaxID=3382301 RepID=UPI00387A90E2